jgi:hypothetical protein
MPLDAGHIERNGFSGGGMEASFRPQKENCLCSERALLSLQNLFA